MTTNVLADVLDAFERGELERALRGFSEDCRYQEPRKDAVVGREALAAHWSAFARSAVRWRFFVDRVIAERDAACVVYRFAVAKGDGEPWRERAGCAVVRFNAHGLIEDWREYDG